MSTSRAPDRKNDQITRSSANQGIALERGTSLATGAVMPPTTRRHPCLLVGLPLIAITLVACGSSSSDSDANGSGSKSATNGPSFAEENSGVRPTDVDPSSACATSTALGQGTPASLVFMFDRSGSMRNDNKWTASSQALKSFFADATTKGLDASLQFFPRYDGDELLCETKDYQAPLVTMTPLPASSFASVIDGQKLLENTPTLPALNGAIGYAKEIQTSGKKAVVVLVTDGEPNHCGSSVDTVANAASAAAAAVRTYVIGVGDNLKNLNKIAAAGGTTSAILVSTSSAAQIADDLKKALGVIAAQALSCDYSIPVPPNGQTIDPAKVNVRRTPTSGVGTTLSYDAQCAGDGWHYDSAASPTRILLCPSTCDAVMKDPGAKVEVFFGCAVKGGIPK